MQTTSNIHIKQQQQQAKFLKISPGFFFVTNKKVQKIFTHTHKFNFSHATTNTTTFVL